MKWLVKYSVLKQTNPFRAEVSALSKLWASMPSQMQLEGYEYEARLQTLLN